MPLLVSSVSWMTNESEKCISRPGERSWAQPGPPSGVSAHADGPVPAPGGPWEVGKRSSCSRRLRGLCSRRKRGSFRASRLLPAQLPFLQLLVTPGSPGQGHRRPLYCESSALQGVWEERTGCIPGVGEAPGHRPFFLSCWPCSSQCAWDPTGTSVASGCTCKQPRGQPRARVGHCPTAGPDRRAHSKAEGCGWDRCRPQGPCPSSGHPDKTQAGGSHNRHLFLTALGAGSPGSRSGSGRVTPGMQAAAPSLCPPMVERRAGLGAALLPGAPALGQGCPL